MDRFKFLPLVFHTCHQESEKVEGEEDTEAEQHAYHIGLRCRVRKQTTTINNAEPILYFALNADVQDAFSSLGLFLTVDGRRDHHI